MRIYQQEGKKRINSIITELFVSSKNQEQPSFSPHNCIMADGRSKLHYVPASSPFTQMFITLKLSVKDRAETKMIHARMIGSLGECLKERLILIGVRCDSGIIM